jgi:hypothetical protein
MNLPVLLLSRFFMMVITTGSIGGFGYLFLVSVFPRSLKFNLIELFSISISLGIVLMIIVVAGMSAVNVPLSKVGLVFLPIFAGIAFFGIRNTLLHGKGIFSTDTARHDGLRFALPFVLFLLLARTLQTHDLFVPNWVDGLIHAMRLQKSILRDAFSFDNVYPGGFYSLALVLYNFHAGTLPEVLLMSGQWLAVIACLNFYVLMCRYFGHSPWGYLSVFVYSFVLLFPSHLLMWGRYPFLLGLTLLPLAILVTSDWVENRTGNYLIAFLFVASLALSHYSAFVIWFTFLFIHLIFADRKDREYRNQWLRLFYLLAPMVLILLPKALNLMRRPDILSGMVERSNSLEFDSESLTILNLILKHDLFFAVLWSAAGIYSLVRKDGKVVILIIWPALILFLTWIQYTVLGYSVTSYVNWMIFASIPAALSCGYLGQEIAVRVAVRFEKFSTVFIKLNNRPTQSLVFLCAAILGVALYFKDANSGTVLFNSEDEQAMTWLQENTDPESTFLINSFIWGDKLMPSDGGGWIELRTGRRTIYPELGELYDMCKFIKDNQVGYVYLSKQPLENFFELRLADFSGISRVVYQTENRTILSVSCP